MHTRDEPRTGRQSPKTDKRTAILRGALEVFAERGVHGVAVPEIAVRAGVGTGTIYRYFSSKEELVNELFREQKLRLAEHLSMDLGEKPDPHGRFVELWDRLVTFAREQPSAYRFLELQDHRPYLDEASRKVEQQLLGAMLARVRELQAHGELRSDVRAAVVMAIVWGAFVQLFKAERNGHVKLTRKDIAAARDACWRLFVP